ncbi:hypothetical protein ACF3VQ_04210 [Yersinia sp. HM-2024]|uniref:hypothetical protein n=1 Tax=Yersinia sp. HM-2024 TaxID=3344550 RepID=UPI00370D5291
MHKDIIQKTFIAVLFGVGVGYIFGRLNSYFYPMVDLEQCWENNYDLEHTTGFYHVYSQVSIVGKEINSSSDMYNGNGYIKARGNIVFDVVNSKKHLT